jgi:dihydrofolate reductase
MGKVLSHMTMSLDGFIAQPDFNVDAASATMLRELTEGVGAMISGRRLFDMTDGWGDNHPVGAPVVVVTHTPPADAQRWPRTTFVDGVEAAVTKAREIAGDKDVTIASPNVIQQALDLGLLDEVCISLVPVLFGEGIRYFGRPAHGHLMLEDPVVVQGKRAVHLRYPVRR